MLMSGVFSTYVLGIELLTKIFRKFNFLFFLNILHVITDSVPPVNKNYDSLLLCNLGSYKSCAVILLQTGYFLLNIRISICVQIHIYFHTKEILKMKFINIHFLEFLFVQGGRVGTVQVGKGN